MLNKFLCKFVINSEFFQILVPVLDCNYVNVIKPQRTIHGVGHLGHARWSSDQAQEGSRGLVAKTANSLPAENNSFDKHLLSIC